MKNTKSLSPYLHIFFQIMNFKTQQGICTHTLKTLNNLVRNPRTRYDFIPKQCLQHLHIITIGSEKFNQKLCLIITVQHTNAEPTCLWEWGLDKVSIFFKHELYFAVISSGSMYKINHLLGEFGLWQFTQNSYNCFCFKTNRHCRIQWVWGQIVFVHGLRPANFFHKDKCWASSETATNIA